MDGSGAPAMRRIVQLTDWLPPEFSAVSQYTILIAEEEAERGGAVTVVGLTKSRPVLDTRMIDPGALYIVGVPRKDIDRASWSRRLIWTGKTNLILIWRAWRYMRQADEIRFTGSPPFMIHFLSVANVFLRKKLTYRITDFYPECIIAALKKPSIVLEALRRLTNLLRRRIDRFEVIGNDMARRLLACGIDPDRVVLRRDMSPVDIGPDTQPLPIPTELAGRKTLLYSGNWGVAHDVDTFLEGYRRHHQIGTGSVLLWLNATGSGADEIDSRLRAERLPFYRQNLVALDQLGNLLVTPDAHLITLRPEFMGFVLPSKVYGCIASRRPVLFVGPPGSDVNELCSADPGLPFRRADVGNASEVADALEELGQLGTFITRGAKGTEDASEGHRAG
jgi:glycosyltransferase involved in cell wall biosynthesis